MPQLPPSTTEYSARLHFPAFVMGCLTLADLFGGRLLLRADQARVYFAGHALNFRCAFLDATGLPCPTCGMTRSIVMSLHGEWAEAWRMAPGGPVLVIGLGLFAVLALASGLWHPRFDRVVRRGVLIYAAAAACIWLGGWLTAIHSAVAPYRSLQ